MERKTRQVEQVYFVSFDGKEFSKEDDCIHHEKMMKGERRECDRCKGYGVVEEYDDRRRYSVKCSKCNGKGYLEKVEEWK